MKPLKFSTLQDKKTGATKIRYVDIKTESFEVAQKYMIKLDQKDINDQKKLMDMAKICNMSKKDFVEYFSEVIE